MLGALISHRWIDEAKDGHVDMDDYGFVPLVGVTEPARLVGWMALVEALAQLNDVAAFCGTCVVSGVMAAAALRAGGYRLKVTLVSVGTREPPPKGFERLCGRGDWSPWEGSGGR
ncbi:hypothetical protein AB0M80_43275 [Amycolatopsis sp. NPDC051045]|uniref:hypothetical protein n=1 Tax=Amycolatopsis sp. NPDC051045 TaxID=3156922 RepID=UPI003443BF25